MFAGVLALLGLGAAQALASPYNWGRPSYGGHGGGFHGKNLPFGAAGRPSGGGTRFNLSWQTGPYGAGLSRIGPGWRGWGHGYGTRRYGYGYGRSIYPYYPYGYRYGLGGYIDGTRAPSNSVTIINEAPPQQAVPVGIPSIADLPADTGIRSTASSEPVLYVIEPVTRGVRSTKGGQARIVNATAPSRRVARRIEAEPDQRVASTGARIIRIEAVRGR